MSSLFLRSRLVILIAAAILLVLTRESLSAQSTSPFYYYYQGARVPLNLDPTRVSVRFSPGLSADGRRAAATAIGDVDNFDARNELGIAELTLVPVRAGRDPLAAIQKLQAGSGIQFAGAVFQFDNGELYAETDEFIVRFKSELTLADIDAFNQANNVTLLGEQAFSDRVLILKPAPGNPNRARDLANTYAESDKVEFAEPNFAIQQARPTEKQPLAPTPATSLTPNDSKFNLQWGLRNTGQFFGAKSGDDINATNAWAVTTGSSAIKIAIIDEGVDATHPDLSGKVLAGYNAMDGTTNTQPTGNDQHGTSTAGIAAANTNNALGIAGECWFCQILPVKVAYENSQGNWVTDVTTLARGIDWAWNQGGADVLNNSWTMASPSDDVLTSIFNAYSSGRGGKGSTIVFAAGNQNLGTVSFPASLNSYVIAVGASNWCDGRKQPASSSSDKCNDYPSNWGSNYGSALDLLAPGEAIYATCNGSHCTDGAFTYFSGTSASTPFVAGAAGLLYSLNPNLTPGQVQTALQNGAKDIFTAGKDTNSGWGRLDASRAMASLYNLAVSVGDGQALIHPGDTLTYTIAYSNTGMTAMGSTTISVTLPISTTYVGSVPAFTAQGNEVYSLNVGTLPSNATDSAQFSVQAQPASGGKKLTMNVRIDGAFPELNTGDNNASDTTAVVLRDIFLPLIIFNNSP